MNDQPPVVAAQEIATKPATPSIEQQLLGIAVDANELVSRIHAGHQEDLNSMILGVIRDRPTAAFGAAEEPVRDAA